jgi:bifunctional UDP-N-acetylglucosamine pyrophosphorylase/glucosamine-1-phosphate N-acetyltransferase
MADVMVLAAGLGTRMNSERAKVLHELAGRPLISYSVRSALSVKPDRLFVVVGHQAAEVEAAVRREADSAATPATIAPELVFVHQVQQRGTGHAVLAARDYLAGMDGTLVVIAGDGPLIKPETLLRLLEAHSSEKNDATLMTVVMNDPTGYGRVLTDVAGSFIRIVEQKDATPDQLRIREVCVSMYCFGTRPLAAALDRLNTDNAQGEYYLTDVPEIIKAQGGRVGMVQHGDPEELAGINNRVELAELERKVRQDILNQLMLDGVTIIDPATTYIDRDVSIGQDTIIHPQVIIRGSSSIGKGCTIHSWTSLRDVKIGEGVTIKPSCVIEDTTVADSASIGPFARLRMQAVVGEGVVIGNFVEVKKSSLGAGTKAQHLTYLGDATIGSNVNIGAGTITCNYDGVRKHQTTIEDNVKIGSDTMLVAPVRVGRGSVTGAGAVVTEDIPPDSLAVGVPAKVKKKLK